MGNPARKVSEDVSWARVVAVVGDTKGVATSQVAGYISTEATVAISHPRPHAYAASVKVWSRREAMA
jgi:hypothetical protein